VGPPASAGLQANGWILSWAEGWEMQAMAGRTCILCLLRPQSISVAVVQDGPAPGPSKVAAAES